MYAPSFCSWKNTTCPRCVNNRRDEKQSEKVYREQFLMTYAQITLRETPMEICFTVMRFNSYFLYVHFFVIYLCVEKYILEYRKKCQEITSKRYLQKMANLRFS